LGNKVGRPAAVGCRAQFGLKRALTAFDLTMMGIGPSSHRYLCAHRDCCGNEFRPGGMPFFYWGRHRFSLRGLCYAEMAAMIPIAGSAYTYAYATMANWSPGS